MKIVNNKIVHATILVVDDDLDIRKAIVSGLELKDIELAFVMAPNALTALQSAKQTKPDLIILDLQMPMGNGFDLVKELKLDPALRDIKILMLTAQDNSRNQWESVELGIDSFIGKPFQLADLEAHAYSLLLSLKDEYDKIREIRA